MAPLVLSLNDYNFRWPGLVQSLIYRIYNYRSEGLNMSPLHRVHPRLQEMISVWADSLFRDGTLHDYRINFDTGYDPHILSSPIPLRVLMDIEIRRGIRYVVRIDMNRDIFSCCDIHSVTENWRMGGVNIFSVSYTHDVRHPHAFGGAEDRIVAAMNGNMFHTPGDGLYMEPAISQKFTTKAEVSQKPIVIEKPIEKKESKEFTDLKSKISDMASVIREHDKK